MPAPKRPQSFIRVCGADECDRACGYTTQEARDRAEADKRLCASCCVKGSRNGFHGKQHSEQTRTRISASKSAYYAALPDDDMEHFREKMREVWKTHHASRPKKSTYAYWVDKLGTNRADELMANARLKWSKSMSGAGNPMYGRPTPHGSGNGWKGHYLGRYFRSLRELSYMLSNPGHATGESGYWRASYIFNGTERTTVPDFIDEENRVVVECKPERLHRTPYVLAKAEAITNLAASRGYVYVLIDPGVVQYDLLTNLLAAGDVVMSDAMKERLERWHQNSS